MIEKRIIESIKLLASSAKVQLSLFPDFVCKPDEIALSLNDWLESYDNNEEYKKNPLFSEDEYYCIKSLNKMVEEFDVSDFTDMAVMKSIKWENVRKEAKKVLKTLNVEYTLPDKSSI